MLGQKILSERNVKLYVTKFNEFKREVERRNWHKELTNFADGSIDVHAHSGPVLVQMVNPEKDAGLALVQMA